MNIHQLSVRYWPEQDRLLVSVNTTSGEELQVWLTRRLMLRLWPTLNQLVIDHFAVAPDARSDGFVDLAALDTASRALLADFRKQSSLQNADFDTPYQGGAGARPLGIEPLLVTEVKLTPGQPEQLQLDFREQLPDGAPPRGCQLNLNTELVFALLQLLGQALTQSQWLLATAVGGVEIADEDDGTAAKSPSPYLN